MPFRGVRGMFFGGGGAKSPFPIFSLHEMLFSLVKISILNFGRTQTNFKGFKKVTRKEKKSPLLIFIPFPFQLTFYSFPFTIFLLPSFLLHFSFFPCLFFPQLVNKNFLVKNVRGVNLPPCPPPVMPQVAFTNL